MLSGFFRRLAAATAPGSRTTGPPTSSNKASSFHIAWDMPSRPLVEVSAIVEVIEPPTVPMLYFWALQANFTKNGSRVGGAHFGLQYHPDYPSNGAVNWGGYADRGGELEGSVSDLPSALNNVNTRTYPWEPNRPYRYKVFRAPNGKGWRGSITDLASGKETVVRDLHIDADAMTSPMVWSEVFAHCDHPSSAVRWTGLQARIADGGVVEPRSVRLNYQTYLDGGCANSNTSVENGGLVQRTNAVRTNPTGAQLQI